MLRKWSLPDRTGLFVLVVPRALRRSGPILRGQRACVTGEAPCRQRVLQALHAACG
jgi:hypothetical protein